ncbi:uncharacterized protein L3040_008627 [Drepanopeziza brunnea f. sp. 'multigermtubi']|uniref:LysM domain-containing protein n=1 Tax=Marssonina brunnea f. sp. multigermtubi (strain MB_m1) TaxID=1072389 RepID=K1W8I8_MARBU|nr:uncharacterized protein MBM_08223 [Drepanopeziza brunnea f. sp. 'multigermtubi' MB_m1]EKD13505.1 hypothetical protein MBM_08223 [Drepanopeziza brunnea f. sp. 'multigermtubi' MB_m1]KAJ5033512.1 hypothetical protein L3040_008627 [Drepanopeziza brunnea f. sp. 'multigermtubi']
MRFNNSLLLLASFGTAIAFRRSCRPDNTNAVTGAGFYTMAEGDTWLNIAADFCTTLPELQRMNPSNPSKPGDIFRLACKSRKRDCARVPGYEAGYYTIAEGDELSLIAQDFCTDANVLVGGNIGVDLTKPLVPGTTIYVPCNWN